MKIVLDKAVYVQKKDLDFLIYKNSEIPSNIMLKIFGPGQSCIDSSNKYDFIKFEDESEIDYFDKINWILDYSDIKDLSEEEIVELRKKYSEERDKLTKSYSSMSDSQKLENVKIYDDIEALSYKAQSLTSFLWYRQGDMEMVFPEDLNMEKASKTIENMGFQKKIGMINGQNK